MFSFLTDLEITVIVGVVALVVGVLFSVKITDTFKGIPSDLRTALTSVETNALAKLKAANVVAAPVVKVASPAASALVAAAASTIAAAPSAGAPAPAAPAVAAAAAPAPFTPIV